MLKILFASKPENWEIYAPHLQRKLAKAGFEFELSQTHPPEEVDYIVYSPNGPVSDFTPFTKAKAVLGLWAGVDMIVGNPTLNLPLARMVDPGMTAGMVEWVTGHVFRHHLGMDAHIHNPDRIWDPVAPPLAKDRPVTVLGLGELGAAVATTLAGLGFPMTGWSKSQKHIEGIKCLSGESGLKEALSTASILILLLPHTTETESLLNGERLALLPKGAVVINPGRGGLVDDTALLTGLEAGHLGHATLDVFRTEPLPKDHSFWSHPRVTVTPHIASETRAESASDTIVENITRGEAGLPFLHLVDRSAGY